MNSPRFLRTALLATGLGGLTGLLGFGCVINVDEKDCSIENCGNSLLCHNQVGSDGMCYCDPGYTWENPGNTSDAECERIPPRPNAGSECVNEGNRQVGDECFCVDGYKWCSDDPADLTCCVDENQISTDTDDPTVASTMTTGADATMSGSGESGMAGTSGGVADESGGNDTGMNTPPDTECTAELEGARSCSNDGADPLEGTTAWECQGGEWVVLDQDLECQGSNSGDFSLGCFIDQEGAEPAVSFECVDGPGTPCEGTEMDACVDPLNLNFCSLGRIQAVDCQVLCQTEGADPKSGITFDDGFCDEALCVCCDFDDPDPEAACPAE